MPESCPAPFPVQAPALPLPTHPPSSLTDALPPSSSPSEKNHTDVPFPAPISPVRAARSPLTGRPRLPDKSAHAADFLWNAGSQHQNYGLSLSHRPKVQYGKDSPPSGERYREFRPGRQIARRSPPDNSAHIPYAPARSSPLRYPARPPTHTPKRFLQLQTKASPYPSGRQRS